LTRRSYNGELACIRHAAKITTNLAQQRRQPKNPIFAVECQKRRREDFILCLTVAIFVHTKNTPRQLPFKVMQENIN
jgi:hypothetical protein